MTAPNLVIGIGGTGNAVVTALMHLCAAGLGPDKLAVALIDQDAANGGGARTNTAVAEYTALDVLFRPKASDQLPNKRPRLFATELDFVGRMPIDIIPDGTNLIGYSLAVAGLEATQSLLTCLFHPHESVPPLDVGFLGHPNVGSVVLKLAEDHGAPALQPLTSYLGDMAALALGGQAVRVMVVGSVFGGTGAAGLPAMGMKVRNQLAAAPPGAATVAAWLMTPYFHYPNPNMNVADVLAQAALPAGKALGHAKLALPYYRRLVPQVFARLYVGGNDPAVDLGYFQPGGLQQANPPVFPELLAAVATAHFLSNNDAPAHPLLYTGRSAPQQYVWNDIPPVTVPGDVQSLLGQLLRWATAWHYWYGPALNGEAYRHHRNDPWYRRHVGVPSQPAVAMLHRGGEYLDPESLMFQAKLASLNGYTAHVLQWAAETCMMGTGLVHSEVKLLNPEVISHVQPGPPPLQAYLSDKTTNDAFAKLICAADGAERSADALDLIHWRLSGTPSPVGASGLGRLVAALHDACTM